MKKLLSLALVALLSVSAILPAQATLTNSSVFTRYDSHEYSVQHYAALITAAANDTTASADSNVITNLNGDIRKIAAGVKASNQTGTSPTLTVQLLGAFSASGPWFVVQGKQGGTAGTRASVASAALAIGTASSTNVAVGVSTQEFGLDSVEFPYLKVRIAVGGTDTPGWTGVAYADVFRK